MNHQGIGPKLNAYLLQAQERYRRNGFGYGRFDCVHFVANWVSLATGRDPLADYRGKYVDKQSGAALLEELDGTLAAALARRLGPSIHPATAFRGDIAFSETLEACGIFFSSGARTFALFLGENGFALHAPRHMTNAFRLPG